MINPKSKKDKEILQFLQANLSDKYHIDYKHYSVSLEWFNLKIDFIITLKDEFLDDKTRPIVYYIQNAQNASMKKLVQIYDLLLSFTSVSVIWDEDEINEKLKPLVIMLNNIADEKHKRDILSPNLKFLMFCDNEDVDEMDIYMSQIYHFNKSLSDLEKDHGVEYDEVEDDDAQEG